MKKTKRHRHLKEIENLLGADFRLVDMDPKGPKPASFQQIESGLEFKLIPEGSFVFGLTDAQARSARKLRNPLPFDASLVQPATELMVGEFLISTTPVLTGSARSLTTARLPEEDLLNSDFFPLTVSRETALEFARSLGCRLPSEAEWEYACKANTKTLFVWGDDLLEERELAPWLDWSYPGPMAENDFGLKGLFTGDWCMDEYRESHSPDAPVMRNTFVVKGGGTLFWPWQDDEWIWCIPAMRMPSTGIGEGGRCAFHLVRELPSLGPTADS